MFSLIKKCQVYKNDLNRIEYVVKNSKYVSIDYKKLQDFSKTLEINDITHPQKKLENKYSDNKLMIFMLLCETINFCFWPEKMWKCEYNGMEYSGSQAMFCSMTKKLEENPDFFEIDNLFNVDYNKFCDIFKSLDKPMPLLKERYKNFREVVNILYSKGNNFFEEVNNITSDLMLLNYIVKTFPCFNDYGFYKCKRINFYKRANLVVRDYYELVPSIRSRIKNISNLMGCADYIIPRLLRDNGVLIYSERLSNMVDNGIHIKHNSKMEIEIRANMLYCIDKIKEELKENTIDTNAMELDALLWNLGKIQKKKGMHHKSLTTYY